MDQSAKIKISVFIQCWVVDNVQILREENKSASPMWDQCPHLELDGKGCQHSNGGINTPVKIWLR